VWVEVDPEAGAGSLPCRITVNLQIELPKVNEIARDMVDDPKLIGGGNVTINLPLEFLLNKSDRATALRIDSSDEIDKVLRGVITALHGFGMPFLNDYATARGLVMQHERGDARIIKQPHWWIFVAASYLELGEKDRARQVLNSAYHLPGLRRRFSKAFDVVS
jgi:hypothetical protein